MATLLLYIGTLVVIISRYLPQTRALWAWLPLRYQWLPPALVAASATVWGGGWPVPSWLTEDLLRRLDVLLGAAVAFALAAQHGLHQPPPSSPPGVVSSGGEEGGKGAAPALLPVALLALVCWGCASGGTVGRNACSTEALEALTASCEVAIQQAHTDAEADRELVACQLAVTSWRGCL